ncbi:DUF6624 domain-containing protein [Streptomyces tauricus]|uniref:DUF6624 domain-containing protein n=1 Tax=Streptomyces tauricus TaxID=68274 RepID=UPI00167C0112|nr:DUF6624 domain-containing protein [Streptomyces tauricus]
MTTTKPAPPDFGIDLLRCLWRAEGLEASMPGADAAAAKALVDLFAAETDLLRRILGEHGWPGYQLVGQHASLCAWRIATYCTDGALQARALELLGKAVHQGDANPLHYALLADRICFNLGQPQRFGTLYVPTHVGFLRLYRVVEPERLDDRRYALGLEPHAEWANRLQAQSLPTELAAGASG